MNNIPRQEYPNPQFERKNWVNLNGEWDFEIDYADNGKDCDWHKNKEFSRKITVPFCMESELSGIGIKDYADAVWYRRKFSVPEEWKSGRTFINFGAVDYDASVFVNGMLAGSHKGGYTAFKFDITDLLKDGENELVVYAKDNTRDPKQPSGKQSDKHFSYKCMYTRTTGIWQTVWLEYAPVNYIKNVKFYPDIENSVLNIEAEVFGCGIFTAEAAYEGKIQGSASISAKTGILRMSLKLDNLYLWEPLCGRLYDLKLTFGEDEVFSYFGMRTIEIDGYKVLINGKKVFQRTVLDQGYYKDGIYTAPDEETLKKDIEISLAAGFNGARLHQKVFEPRFLYHCDKMGYIVWGEYGNWGFDHSSPESITTYFGEWKEAVERDFNHPAIVGWIPFNETPDNQLPTLISAVYDFTKALDSTRPCIDASGWNHVKTDIFDVHNYIQEAEILTKRLDLLKAENKLDFKSCKNYDGGPVFFSEYGGIKWVNETYDGWGYGNAPKTMEEFLKRYEALTTMILNCDRVFGLCYTQLYDVEQETNGLYTFEREPKFDMEIIKRINTGISEYEKGE